ncbi:MAG: hypothetical protein OXI96_10445 [Acidimicrobiaceae bacterium]|nr:hypothetical protein [Acidimicrobiaceae bacterium]
MSFFDYDTTANANSRLHQFLQGHLIVENPDDPTRPINSPKWCYQVTPEALDLIRSHGTLEFKENLRRYLKERPGLEAAYRRERDLLKIPVDLPQGVEMTLSITNAISNPGNCSVVAQQDLFSSPVFSTKPL